MNENGYHHADILQTPTLQDMKQINDELGMMCSEQELQKMTAMHVARMRELETFLQMVGDERDEAATPVKYPRGPGHRPAPGDNPHNAWAWRCDISGASTGHLAGRTVAVKDNVAVSGVPMRCGSKVMQEYVPEFDATVVTRILDAGGRVMGKSGMEELGMTGSSVCSSDDVITNPWDTSRDAGGSSSGSAVLVASGHVDMAIGGDQGGSVRIPASFTGIVGLKPTWGLVPYTGAVNVEHTVDHLGPMAKTVHDCALLLEVIAGYDDGKDPRQFPTMTVPEYTKLMNQDIRGKRVGLLKEGFELCSHEVVHDVVMNTAVALTQAGCIVKETSVPLHKAGKHLFSITAGLSRYKTMFEYSDSLGTKGIHHTSMQMALERGFKHSAHDLNPLVKSEVIFQRQMDSLYRGRLNAKGRNLVHQLDKMYDAALGVGEEGVDVLVMPTVPHLPPRIPPRDVTITDLAKHAWSNNVNTMPFNLTGHPAITVNAGFSPPDPSTGKGKLPIGLMIVGRKFDEVTVLQVAGAVEKLGNTRKNTPLRVG